MTKLCALSLSFYLKATKGKYGRIFLVLSITHRGALLLTRFARLKMQLLIFENVFELREELFSLYMCWVIC